MNLIIEAARIASHAHRGQFRKYPDACGILPPFIVHPARVAAAITADADLLEDCVADIESLVAAAWLHDVLEDTLMHPYYLGRMMPQSVVDIVRGMTKQFAVADASRLDGGPVCDRVLPGGRPERKAIEREYLRQQSGYVKLLKAYDRLDNLRDLIAGDDAAFLRLYAKETEHLLVIIRPSVPAEVMGRIDAILAKISVRV